MFDLRLESFIEEPEIHLARLCSFLGVASTEDYLEDCARIVFESPKKSRFDLPWTEENIALVKARMSRFSFLKGYSFDEDMEKRELLSGFVDSATGVAVARKV